MPLTPRDREAIGEVPNPLGLDGIEFIEYATSRPQALGQVLEMMGFRPVARHRSREVLLYCQGGMKVVINAHVSGRPSHQRPTENPVITAVALRVRDAATACQRALDRGAWLENKPKAMREAGFSQVMLKANDIVGHEGGVSAAVRAVKASGLRVTGFQVLRDFEGLSGHLHGYKIDIAKAMLEMADALAALGYRGDHSFEVFNDDYQQMPLPLVAQRARASAVWLGEDVLRRAVPLPKRMRLKAAAGR